VGPPLDTGPAEGGGVVGGGVVGGGVVGGGVVGGGVVGGGVVGGGVVGGGNGLADAGDGDGVTDVGEEGILLLGVLLALVGVALPWVADGEPEPEPAGLPEPLVLPGPPTLLEVWVPDEFPFSREANGPRRPPMAKTPATTSTTAPATARAGRSQAIAGPTEFRSGAPAFCRRRAEAQASILLRMGRNDRSRPPSLAALTLASPAVTAPAPAPAAEPDRIALNQDWHRTASTQPRVVNSLRRCHHCRLSHGSASRAWIFVKPSPTGSI
jgi:hypothetical protein